MLGLVLLLSTAAAEDDGDPVLDDDVEEIVVTGSGTPHRRGDAPVAVEVIDREAIEASGSQDVAELLEQHPGVDVTRGFLGAGVRLRGLEADHTLILVDGQRVVGRKDGTYDLSRIPVDSIERIEIVKGASSALYGSDALGGVVHIVTRDADGVSAHASARGGAPSAVDTTAGISATAGDLGVRLDAGWHGMQPFEAAPSDPDDPTTFVNGMRQGDVAARLDYDVSDDVDLWLRGSYTATDATGVDAGQGGAVLDRRNLTEDGLVTLGVDALPDTVSRWNTTLGLSSFRDQYLVDQRLAAPLDDYQQTRQLLGQTESRYSRVLGRHVATVGFNGSIETIRNEARLSEPGNRARGGVYAQDEWTVLDATPLVIVPGVRGDLDSWFGGAVAPSLGLRFDPVRALVLRASVGRGWRAPSFRELLLSFDNSGAGYQIAGNPDLRPEETLSVTAGLELAPAETWSVAVQAHHDELRNLIQIGTVSEDPGLTQFQYMNVARARSRGVEGIVALDPARWLGFDLSGTLLDARDLTEDAPLEGRANLRGTGAVRLNAGERLPSLTTRGVVVGPRPLAGQTAPPYALLDARLSQALTEGLSMFAGGENLLDAGDPVFLPTPPRLLYAGLDARI